jgi:hypothetical protein
MTHHQDTETPRRAESLVRRLFEGEIDVIGDVHGEIEALDELMGHLGYTSDGAHPEGRRMVFLGDLTDRGPDSLAVVELVRSLIDSGRAQCVLGNHDLNILLNHEKAENKWFFGKPFLHGGRTIPQKQATDGARSSIVAFFKELPLVLERPGLRIVHACWNPEMVNVARAAEEAIGLHDRYHDLIEAEIKSRENLDLIERRLQHQNRNPVKMLTSGPEERADQPFIAGGKVRQERRVQWWKDYDEPEVCVFGHYATLPEEPIGAGRAICIDFGAGKRWVERLTATAGRPFRYKLAALRFPEMRLVLDDGKEAELPKQNRR